MHSVFLGTRAFFTIGRLFGRFSSFPQSVFNLHTEIGTHQPKRERNQRQQIYTQAANPIIHSNRLLTIEFTTNNVSFWTSKVNIERATMLDAQFVRWAAAQPARSIRIYCRQLYLDGLN